MLKLIRRSLEYVAGYKEYCQEMYDHNIVYFCPTNPNTIDKNWFERTKPLYDQKENGLLAGQPASIHYWAIDGDQFIGEFQLRTNFPEKVMFDIGSIGYAVRVSQWGKGYGTEILRKGLEIAKAYKMEKVLLTINDENTASIHICEKFGGMLEDIIEVENNTEGRHKLRRYWIIL